MIRVSAAATAMVLSTTTVNASGSQLCSKLSEMAESVAEARYNGVAMRNIIDRMKVDNESYESIIISVIDEAYSLPNYSTDEYQQRAIREFGNEVYRTCIK